MIEKRIKADRQQTESLAATTDRISYLDAFIDRRRQTFDAIGNGHIRPGEPWRQGLRGGDGLDATFKVAKAKDAVDGSVVRVEHEMATIFTNKLDEVLTKLPIIKDGGDKGYISRELVDEHVKEVTVFAGLPTKISSLDRGLDDPKFFKPEKPAKRTTEKAPIPDGRTPLPDDPGYALPTGETFYGDHAQLVKTLLVKDTGYMLSDDIITAIWPDNSRYGRDSTNYSRSWSNLKQTVTQTRKGLEETDWELVGRRGYPGGYDLRRRGSN